MTTITILTLSNDGSQKPLVVCRLAADGTALCEGDVETVKNLNEAGILDTTEAGKKLFPKDGAAFLAQLKNNFASGYLSTVEED